MKKERVNAEISVDESAATLRRKRIIAVISAVISIALLTWLGFFIVKAFHISAESEGGLTNAAQNFKTMIDGYGNAGVLVAFGIHVLQVIISPLPGEIVEIGMGLCFGWFGGAAICLLGSALGGLIILVFVKKLGVKFVELFVPVEKINNYRFLSDEKKLERLIFIIYLIPGTPKDLLVFFFGLTKIKIPTFLIISTLARIPSIISSTVGGNFIVEQKYLSAVLLFAITGLVSLLGLVAYNAMIKKLNERKEHKKAKSDTSIKQKEQ